jgi:hypothetical protein
MQRPEQRRLSQTRARQVFEDRQGYGYASRRGLAEASGDLLVLAEPDGTFLASDIIKLLSYSDQCDAVFGTRTNRELIWHQANMGVLLRWGNWAVAKLVRLLFNASRITDVGCTYRLLSRRLVDYLEPRLTIGGSQLGPELILQTVLSGVRHVEVPVNYLPRVGVSSVTGQLRQAFVLGCQMVALICWTRVRTLKLPKRSAVLRLEPAFEVPSATPAAWFPTQRELEADTVIDLTEPVSVLSLWQESDVSLAVAEIEEEVAS